MIAACLFVQLISRCLDNVNRRASYYFRYLSNSTLCHVQKLLVVLCQSGISERRHKVIIARKERHPLVIHQEARCNRRFTDHVSIGTPHRILCDDHNRIPRKDAGRLEYQSCAVKPLGKHGMPIG